jgi:hypothetical protein
VSVWPAGLQVRWGERRTSDDPQQTLDAPLVLQAVALEEAADEVKDEDRRGDVKVVELGDEGEQVEELFAARRAIIDVIRARERQRMGELVNEAERERLNKARACGDGENA